MNHVTCPLQYVPRSHISATCIIVLCLFIVPNSMASEAPQFRRLTTEQGLAHDSVTTLFQDSRGFVWIGTLYGLNRYDGYEFKTFRHVSSDASTLPSSHIRAIAEDASGTLWIGTQAGLARYNRKTEQFHRVALHENDIQVTSLLFDTTGQLWVGTTSHGIFRIQLHPNDHTIQNKYQFGPETLPGLGPYKGWIHCLYKDVDGSIWIGTEMGLAHWTAQKEKTVTPYDLHQSQKQTPVLVIFRDTSHQLWVGTPEGLYQIQKNTSHSVLHLSNHAITAIQQDQNNQLWVGTRNKGILQLNLLSKTTHTYKNNPTDPNSLSTGTIHAILQDKSGLIWVSTYGGGITQIIPNAQKIKSLVHNPLTPNSLSSSSIFSVLQDHHGTIWVGTDAGLNQLTPNLQVTNTFTPNSPPPKNINHNVVRALYENPKGQLWVGTDAGLNLLDHKRNIIATYQNDPTTPNSLSDSKIRCIYEDKNNILWIGTNAGGLNRFDPKTGNFSHPFKHLTYYNCIRSIYPDTSGMLWLTGPGLIKYDPVQDTYTEFRADPNNPHTLRTNSTYDVAPASDGGLWVCSYDGLSHFNQTTQQFTHYTTHDGLASNVIYDIVIDKEGDIWVSTDRGISRIKVSWANNTRHIQVRNFDTKNGVAGTEFNSGAGYLATDGTVFFGGMGGLNILTPSTLQYENTHRPPIVFTTCEVYTEQKAIDNPPQYIPGISETTTLNLPHNTTHVSIGFAALDYTSPEKNTYAYWLEGLKPVWVNIKQQRHLNLSLAPGRYKLHVKGANNTGLWNEQGRTLNIVVETPYWMTTWFRFGALFTILGLLFLGHRLRMQRIRAQSTKLDKLVQELEAKNTELERFTYTVSHDLKTPLVTIEGFLGMIEKDVHTGQLERVPKDAEFIRHAVLNMRELLDDLLEISRVGRVFNTPEKVQLSVLAQEAAALVQGRFSNKNITISIDKNLPTIIGDKRQLIEVFQNLLDNAAKFSTIYPNAHVEIGQRHQHNETVIFVKDNGIGIEPRYHNKVFDLFERLDTHIEGTGIGLALVKRIITFHNGRIWIESKGKGTGSTFCFTLQNLHIPNTPQ